MGLNAYFAFQVGSATLTCAPAITNSSQVVGINGSGSVPYRTALTAIFVEGFIFVILALTGMRQWLVKLIPATLKTATGVGIGFLLTEIGLSYSAGIGAITGGGRSAPLTLGGCPAELLDPNTGMCTSGQMSNPKVILLPASHERPSMLTKSDVACHLLRRNSYCIPNGIQNQVCPRHRHRTGLYHLLAVSSLPLQHQSRITNSILGATRPLPISQTLMKATHASNSSSKSLPGIRLAESPTS